MAAWLMNIRVLPLLCSLSAVPAIGSTSPADTTTATTAAELSRREVAEKIAPAVVLVKTEGARETKQGSGFVVDAHGVIVTALHVVDGARKVSVVLADGRRIESVEVRAFDVEKDLTLLQLSPPAGGKEMTAAGLGKASSARPGDAILVIGNPLGLQQTVTEGIVSAWREEMAEVPADETSDVPFVLPSCRLLQISASISPGSSGGPVVDQHGEVIGVATSGVNFGMAGLNFAVPVDELGPLLDAGDPMDLRTFQKRVDDVRLDLARPHFDGARIALDAGRRPEAKRHLERAIRLFPTYEEALLLSGKILAQEGNLEKAVERISEAIKANEESAEAWFQLGSVYTSMARGQSNPALSTKAQSAFEKALMLDARHAGAAIGLAVILAGQGALSEAEELLRKAVEWEPGLADAWHLLGEVRLRRSQFTEAEAAYKQALWGDPNHALSHFALARLYSAWDQRRQQDAPRHWKEFLRLAGDDPAYAEEREIARRLIERYFPYLVTW